jgi:hypothetical protein
MIKAECAWEINRIILDVNGTTGILLSNVVQDTPRRFKHGTCDKVQFDLTLDEAKQLAGDLLAAVDRYETMERELDALEPGGETQ